MKRTISRGIAVAVVVVLMGCAEQGADDSPRELAEAALATAQEKYAASAEAGFAWRNARLALEAAESALALEDYAGAQSQAELATTLAEASLAQAAREAEAWSQRAPFGSGS